MMQAKSGDKFPVPILAYISPVTLRCHSASLCCAVPIFSKMWIAACHRVTMRVKGFRSCGNDSHILDGPATGVYRESVAPLILYGTDICFIYST